MTRVAGWIVVLAGIGHTVGSVVESVPDQVGAWFDGSMWDQGDYARWSDAAAAFWYSWFSFGPPLLLLGVVLLWLARRGITPPAFVAWALAAWVVGTFVATGPSPLPILLVAAGLLLVEARRARGEGVISPRR